MPAKKNVNIAAIDLMQASAQHATLFLKSLSHPKRLEILCLLSQGEACVSDLQNQITLSQSALSQHLAILRTQNLVQTRRASQHIYYSLAKGPTLEIMAVLQKHFCK
jgi:DNA-binding transcriptional ArsR family regulator